jgi:hypothetical protein
MTRRRRPGGFGFDAVRHEKHHWWRSLLLRAAICAAVSWLLIKLGGLVGGVASLALWGRLMAQDLMGGIELLGAWLRGRAFRPVQGQFYAFRGQRMRVFDDEVERCRWIAVSDLEAALEDSLRVSTLQRDFGAGLRCEDGQWYLRDQEALDCLWTRQADRAGALRAWVEHEVWYPARGRKASYTAKGAPAGAPKE